MSNPKIQLRHDTASNWSTANPVLLDGEIGIEKYTGFVSNVVVGYDNICTISNDGILTVNQKPTGLTEAQLNTAFKTNSTVPLGKNSNPLFDCKFRIKFKDNSTDNAQSIFRQYVSDDGDSSKAQWDCSFAIYQGSENKLEFAYHHWDFRVSCNLPSDYLTKYYTYRVFNENENSPVPTIQIIDDDNSVVSSATGPTQIQFVEPASLDNLHTALLCGHDCFFMGDIDLLHTSMTFKNGTWNWVGGVISGTKLKIGDGETAWNDLPYII